MSNLQVNSAVIVILQKDNKVLLFKRKNTGWADGFYTVPSGKIDQGELPTDAAVREVFEEVGVKIKKEDLKFVHVDFVKDSVIGFTFIAENWTGEFKLEDEKAEDLRWFSLDELPESIAGHGKQILENIKNGKYFLEVE